jgi:hypothetical protein
LRRSDIVGALGDSANRVNVAWVDWARTPGVPLRVQWHTPADGIGAKTWHEQPVTVWVSPVKRAEASAIREAMRGEALPDLARWVSAALSATETWRAAPHERSWTYGAGKVEVKDGAST